MFYSENLTKAVSPHYNVEVCLMEFGFVRCMLKFVVCHANIYTDNYIIVYD